MIGFLREIFVKSNLRILLHKYPYYVESYNILEHLHLIILITQMSLLSSLRFQIRLKSTYDIAHISKSKVDVKPDRTWMDTTLYEYIT